LEHKQEHLSASTGWGGKLSDRPRSDIASSHSIYKTKPCTCGLL